MVLALLPRGLTSGGLNIFPIKNYTPRNNIVLAVLKGVRVPQYIQDFIDIVVDLCSSIDTENLIK